MHRDLGEQGRWSGLHPEILQPHRLPARRPRLKAQLVRYSTRFALSGLGQLMLALTSALLLIVTVVLGMHVGTLLAGGALAWFVFAWYLLPLWSRVRTRR